MFGETVGPFLKSYCIDCHSGDNPKAEFDVGPYRSVDPVVEDIGHWELILEQFGDSNLRLAGI